MNKTKIEWCDATWNPVTGCYHGCPYCYAARMTIRFSGHWNDNTLRTVGGDGNLHVLDEPMHRHTSGKNRDVGVRSVVAPFPFGFDPTFHRYRLEEPQTWKKPQTIFVCSMADLFGEWVPDAWIEEVFAACKKAPQHRYLFLTKNPYRYIALANEDKLPRAREFPNFWYGSTVTREGAKFFGEAVRYNTFLSIEPLMEPLNAGLGSFGGVRWIIAGAMTGRGKEGYQPKREWVENIVEAASITQAAVFMKDSLIHVMGESNMVREFPWAKGGD